MQHSNELDSINRLTCVCVCLSVIWVVFDRLIRECDGVKGIVYVVGVRVRVVWFGVGCDCG